MYKLFLIVLLAIGVSNAQTSTSAISGTVTDSSGGTVPGAKVVLTNEATGVSQAQSTTQSGVYSFPGLSVGTYTVSVEMKGFKTTRQSGNVLQVESPQTINVAMEVGSAAEVVTVAATAEALETSDATVGNVVTQKEIVDLPLNGRNPLGLLALEPGVVQRSSNAAGTGMHVNGSRDMASNTTIDGIDANESSVGNPMNNLYRMNPDSIQEYKVTTSNPSAESGRNSGANTSIATRSGTNRFHGTAFEFFRNTNLNANEFFANALGQPKPDLKLNQFGGNIGGPIRRNRTFFFGSWQKTVANFSQPVDQAYSSTPLAYTPTALSGIYRYWVANPRTPFVFAGQTIVRNNPVLVDPHSGALMPGVRTCATNTDQSCIASFNMFANDPSRIGADPTIKKLFDAMPAPNLYTIGDGLNTGGYQWNAPTRKRGNAWMTRIDHNINSNHNLFARYLRGTDNTLGGDPNNSRPQLFPGFPPLGEVYRSSHNGGVGLHSVLSAHIANEFTFGVSRFSALFTQGEANPDWPNVPAYSRAAGTAFNNIDSPYRNVPRTFRVITTPQVLDNLSIVRGSHIVRTGFNFRFYRHNDQRGQPGGATVTPLISFSSGLRGPTGFNLPTTATTTAAGINSTDSTRLQGSINDILGIPASLSQTFLGDLSHNNYLPFASGNKVNVWTNGNRLKQYDSYVQDEWKVRKNLTFTLGVRWEVNPAPSEASGAVYVPDRPIVYSQGLVQFVHADRWLKTNNTNAAGPRVSVAWSPRKSTVIRTGYSMAFDTLNSFQVTSVAGSVPGLTATCTVRPTVAPAAGCASVPNLRIGQGFPQQLPPPTLQPSAFTTPPATLYSSAQDVVTFDPYLKVPTVHQWNFSIQHQLPTGFVLQTGYVGKRGTRLYRGYDVNQINADPILPAFLLMQQNVNTGCRADGTTCPTGVTGKNIPLVTSGLLTAAFVNSTTTANELQLNNAGAFAGRIESNNLNAKLRPNQQFNTITYVDSGGDSYYHSLQAVLQKRFDAGLLLRVAYTFSKSMDDQSVDPIASSSTGGLSNTNSRTPTDIRNWRNERGLSDFDRPHVLTASWVYNLPIGRGQKFGSSMPSAVNTVVGGWSLKGIVTAMSGEPFTVRSGYYTTNDTHHSRVDIIGPKPKVELKDSPGVVGPSYFVGESSSFAIPAPGTDGSGRNLFRAVPFWNIDLAASKEFRITEKVKMELRSEFFNALNHPNFDNPRDASNSSTAFLSTLFGHTCCATVAPASTRSIVDTGESARVIQFALKLLF